MQDHQLDLNKKCRNLLSFTQMHPNDYGVRGSDTPEDVRQMFLEYPAGHFMTLLVR